MSGHSKWNNIKNKKGKSDAERGKVFTKLGREILVAVKEGGPDPASNSKLRDVIAKCKANNMPNDNIDRSIKNRTAGDVRHILDKFGGNLGTNGSVSWMFDKKGVILVEKSVKMTEDELMMEAIEAGAENFEADEDVYEITTTPEDFSIVRETLEAKGIEFLDAEVKMVPQNYMSLDAEGARKMNLIIEKMEELDDVQEIWHNWDEEE